MKKYLAVLLTLFSTSTYAGWQYPGGYGVHSDDGGRMAVSLRGGASFASAKLKNEVGVMTEDYWVDSSGGIIPDYIFAPCEEAGLCDDFNYAGTINYGDLPVNKNISNFTWAAGVSLGWILPGSPQWRIEGGWDHVAESDYNSAPLFAGDVTLTGGLLDGEEIPVQMGGLQSEVATDVFSLMFFYDFFEGLEKPIKTFIPYVGFGLGYADITTTTQLSDLYGNLSWSPDLENYAVPDSYGILQFYKNEKHNSNIAGLLAVGFSYGIASQTFIDFGIRLTYVPGADWSLGNPETGRTRDWLSSSNFIYTNVMLGVRFEF